MDSVTQIMLMILGYVVIDFCARCALKSKKSQQRYKSAGIIALIIMSLTGGPRKVEDKNIAIKQFFLTAFITVYLAIANYFLLIKGVPEVKIAYFAMLLSPLFVMPFFNFIYELFLVRPLSVDIMLNNFNLRSILSLIISANIIFVSLEPLQNIVSVIGHFLLCYGAFLGSFYLCSDLRKKPSPLSRYLIDELGYYEPSVLRYLASIMEVFYYLLLLFYIFIDGPLSILLVDVPRFYIIYLSLGFMLLITTLIMTFRYILPVSLDVSFYEERVLPLSFLLFGLANLIPSLLID